ncbi:apolipoprotein A-IV-like [Suncus etruscus]|uniref:apolipoprotein A-IV-like n=1 Tax=Suncus etruscus TaxID=109475 RepID=UPI00210FFCD9|nr:apolipoprotein A-IV-like [Suncus etruscus]
MASHIQEVKQKIGENARLLLERLGPYFHMLKSSVSRISFLNAQVIKSIKDLENALHENVESLQALVPSMPNKIKENIAMNLLKFQAILMTFKHEVKKTINESMKKLSSSLAPFVKDTQNIDHQLEGLSFQLKRETVKLVANLSVKTYELWKLLEPLPESKLKGNKGDLHNCLAILNRLMNEQFKIFQCKVSSNIETFEKVMGQKLEEFGQKLGPHAGYMDDHLIFLEKELKDKVKSFFNNLKNKAENEPNPEEPCKEPCPIEQSSANLG